ncbi:hypothetical protein BDF19DRAFT_279439 [Syncephalis fuscata]|nr:hypothetical protein BDF19DRAFT_279439 [Syncephalis fuscata]
MATAAASNWNLTGRMVDTFVCPSPLIQDPLWPGKSQSPQCVNGCCIPCPVTNAFYPPNTLEIGFRVASLLRGISTLLVLFLFASYLVLPGKRKYPTSLIFFSTISIVIFSLSAFFVITDPKTIQCADAITQSTMNNNPLCGIQGAILIFGSFSACFWVAIIILNLHLHTVWNNQWMSRYYKWVVIVGWSYSAIGTAVPLALNVVQ